MESTGSQVFIREEMEEETKESHQYLSKRRTHWKGKSYYCFTYPSYTNNCLSKNTTAKYFYVN